MVNERSSRQAVESIIGVLHDAGFKAFLAGGCVRDLLLGVEPKDYDVATDARPDEIQKMFRRTNHIGAKFGVVLVRLWGHQIEVATFRSDGSYRDGRHPETVTFGDQIQDAHRRDFTINGMFLDIKDNQVFDHVGGREDLDKGVIRAIGDPFERFREDHLRMLRAVRFATRLEFALESQTREAMEALAPRLTAISAERIREELHMILTHESRAAGWSLIASTGLVNHLAEGLEFDDNEISLAEKRLGQLESPVTFRIVLAAVLKSKGPQSAEAICRALTSPNVESRGVGWLLRQLPRVARNDDLELADFKILMNDERFNELCSLLQADLLATSALDTAHARLINQARSIPMHEVAPPSLVVGEDLINRNVEQGPKFSQILDKLYRAQLNLQIGSREEALELLDRLIEER